MVDPDRTNCSCVSWIEQMARTRDYKKEYARRKARALARGYSLSQARGKPKPGEPLISGKSKTKSASIDRAIKSMQGGQSMTKAARSARISPQRLAWILASEGRGAKQGRRWVLGDRRPRRIPTITLEAQTKAITVPGFDEASKAGHYHNAIRRFLNTQDLNHLEPYKGDGLTDVKGKFHPFETDPNVLIRHALKDEPAFHEIYRILEPE